MKYPKNRWCKHGHAKGGVMSPEFCTWNHIKGRCENPANNQYHNYGGRGIKLCPRWRDFRNFLADMGAKPSQYHSIDRLNNDGDYEPNNCRWATRKQQTRNTRRNIHLEYHGRTQCLEDWASELGVCAETLRHRIHRGWSVSRALTAPSGRAGVCKNGHERTAENTLISREGWRKCRICRASSIARSRCGRADRERAGKGKG